VGKKIGKHNHSGQYRDELSFAKNIVTFFNTLQQALLPE